MLGISDDSNGDIRNGLKEAFEFLEDLTKLEIGEELRKLLMEYSLSGVNKESYKNWSLETDLLKIAVLSFYLFMRVGE